MWYILFLMITSVRLIVLISVLIALMLSIPVLDNLFAGILVTYAGLTLLNLYPFHKKLHFPGLLKIAIILVSAWCIGYGWRVIINNSQNTPPGIASFLSISLLLVSVAGWFLCLYELIINRSSTNEPLVTQGIQKLVRHPQVLFSITFLCGLMMHYWSLTLLLTAPLWIIGFVSYAALEEKMDLVPRYDKNYLNYCEKTPGIIPNIMSIRDFLDQYRK